MTNTLTIIDTILLAITGLIMVLCSLYTKNKIGSFTRTFFTVGTIGIIIAIYLIWI